jgi:hypothetical protein
MFVTSKSDVFNLNGSKVAANGRRSVDTPYGKNIVGQSTEDVMRAVREALAQ